MSNPIDCEFRVIVIGDHSVGKSSMLRYYAQGLGPESKHKSTVGMDTFIKFVDVLPEMKVKLYLWDTAGQEKYRSITKAYYRGSAGVVVVYDITNRNSFLHLEEWMETARSNVGSTTVFTLVGHKADDVSKRAVSQEEGREFARYHNMLFRETSAVTGQNVHDTFLSLTQEICIIAEKEEEFLESNDWSESGNNYSDTQEKKLSLYIKKKCRNGCC